MKPYLCFLLLFGVLILTSCKTTGKKKINLVGAHEYCKEYPDDEYCIEE